MYTTATAFLEALVEQKVEFIFANLGSDHAGLVEALSEAKANGRPMPKLITCPNEMVALSIAHGHAQISGRAQAVVVHVECGTQALAGAVHNAAKARIPVLIFAGTSPFTQEGEMVGSRNEFIQWIQDVHDQRGLVRGYMRYDNEIRTGANIKQVTHRAMQFAHSDPKGPVYLMASREVLEAETKPVTIDMDRWRPLPPQPIAERDALRLATELAAAQRPLIVTSYLGRNVEAVERLTTLCRRLGIGVLESVPSYLNFPHDDALYQGNQWNHPEQNRALAEADMVLVIDSDVPWISLRSRPDQKARIHHIDIDPLKEQMPLWYIGAHRSYRADAASALAQIIDCLDTVAVDEALVTRRKAHYAARSAERRAVLATAEAEGQGVTVACVMAAVRKRLDERAIVLNESITNYHLVHDHLAPVRPGAILASGGGSLGWNGGAAIGVKLARPDATVVAVTGDGSYLFTVPSSVHWIARRYKTPFLQIVLNNRGWNAPRHSVLSVHPEGFASLDEDIGISFAPSPDYGGIAAASGGALALVIDRRENIESVIAQAFATLADERRSVVIDVRLDDRDRAGAEDADTDGTVVGRRQ